MAFFKSNGIVFRSIKYGETSIITDIYTREKGLRSFLISGVRRSRSRMSASLFQHGNILEMVAYDKESGKLGRIREVQSAYLYREIPEIAQNRRSAEGGNTLRRYSRMTFSNSGSHDIMATCHAP